MLFTIEYPTYGDIGQVSRDNPGIIVDDYYSAVWTERFNAPGEAILELPIKYWPLTLDMKNYPNGHYLRFSESDYLMNLYRARVKQDRDDPRVILEYKSIENFLSYRRTSYGPEGYPWYENPGGTTIYTLYDLWVYEFYTKYNVPMFYLPRPSSTTFPGKDIEIHSLDFKLGDTVLSVTEKSCNRGTDLTRRHGFKIFVTDSGEQRTWSLQFLPSLNRTDPPDFTEHISALEFAFDPTNYANAALVRIPHYTSAGGGTLTESGFRLYRTGTFNRSPVRDWNRVEEHFDFRFDGTDVNKAANWSDHLTTLWGYSAFNLPDTTARRSIQSNHNVEIVASTSDLGLDMDENFKYKKDFQLGTIFKWTPYAGLGQVAGAYFKNSPELKAMITEFTWSIDESGVQMSPGITM
jgi:hypothetical protein